MLRCIVGYKRAGTELNSIKAERINTLAEKKKFLLRIDENVYAALEKWAANDLRSINAQIEFLLKESLIKANRPVKSTSQAGNPPGTESNSLSGNDN